MILSPKYFSSLVQSIVIEDYLLEKYTIFKFETKKNTTLSLVELLAVTWVLYVLRHPVNNSHSNMSIVMEQLTSNNCKQTTPTQSYTPPRKLFG